MLCCTDAAVVGTDAGGAGTDAAGAGTDAAVDGTGAAAAAGESTVAAAPLNGLLATRVYTTASSSLCRKAFVQTTRIPPQMLPAAGTLLSAP